MDQAYKCIYIYYRGALDEPDRAKLRQLSVTVTEEGEFFELPI